MVRQEVVAIYRKVLARGAFYMSLLIIVLISLVTLAGLIAGAPMLGLSPAGILPMKAVTAVSMIISAISLMILARQNISHTQRVVSRVLSSLVLVISVVSFLVHFFNNVFILGFPLLENGPAGVFFGDGYRMSVMSSILFTMTGSSLLCLSSARTGILSLGHFLIWPVTIMSYMVPVSHILDVRLFPVIWNTEITIWSISCFFLLSVAILFQRPNSILMRIFTSNNTGSKMARWLMPGIIILPVVIAIARLYGEREGIFDSGTGVILVAITYTVLFSILLWFVTRMVNKLDSVRMRNEERIRENDALLTSLIEGTSDCIYIKDTQGKYLLFNSASVAFTGKPQSEVLGKDDRTLFGEEDGRYFMESDRNIILKRELSTFEENVIDHSGKKRIFLTTKGPVFNSNGSVKGIFGMSHDITHLKEIEESLRAKEQRLKFHFENSPLASIEWDSDFIVTHWSAEAHRLFGWSPGETIGKRIETLNMIFPEDLPIVTGTMERLYAGGEAVVVSSNRNVTKTGKVISCTWYNSVLYDSHGKMNSVLSLVMDITERLEHEERLKYQADLLEMVSDAIISTDMNFKVTKWNRSAERLYGWSAQEIIGQTLSELLQTKFLDDTNREESIKAIGTLGTWTGEVVQKKKDGSDVYIMSSVSALKDKEGTLTGVLAVNRDITKKRIAEMALMQAKDELESKVKERTSALRKSLTDLAIEQQRFRDVLDKIPAYVKLINPDMYVPFSNKIFQECFGDPTGKKCHVFMFDRETPCENCGAVEVFQSKVPQTWEWEGPNGRTYQVSDFPFTDTDGTSLVLEMGLDITEKKDFDKHLLSKILETEEKDRRRFATDLHDDLGPTLAMIKLHLDLLSKPISEEKRAETIKTCESMLTGAIGKMRAIANNLLPRLIESYGLETALNSFLKTIPFSGESFVTFKSNLKGARLEMEKELHLYRIICELINNSLRHSGASKAELNIILDKGYLTISYSDNGSGYDINRILSQAGGMGLQNILNRVGIINGTIDFQRKNNKTVVVVRVSAKG
jgi:PAS domain S-box-containing protein